MACDVYMTDFVTTQASQCCTVVLNAALLWYTEGWFMIYTEDTNLVHAHLKLQQFCMHTI